MSGGHLAGFQIQAWQKLVLAPLPLTPTHKNPKRARRSNLPSLLLILAPPEARAHVYPTDLFSPLHFALPWFGEREMEWGGDLQGGASSKPEWREWGAWGCAGLKVRGL